MTFDASDRKSVRRHEKAAKLADVNRIAYTRQIMSETFGREWMYQLLLRCNVFHTPFTAGDTSLTAFNCGAQNVGLQIFMDVAAHCPTEYTLMMQEQALKENLNGRRNDTDSDPAAAAARASEDTGRDDSGPDDDPDPADGDLPANRYVSSEGFVNWNGLSFPIQQGPTRRT